ncbi:molybdopterin synthase catalytic subunit MoaE [Reinekea blandensis]|uniref:Molybdopterin synthase catalytic subunit n=1 Tax=Reinekea blandensis MED297 TaxID=314283 RepID=A4BI43_9GAMM|nr:molybdopterin synthase catalytic subunit MoaE [Reinekea blandensis]EAR08186.1 putative molybdenum cofactor biosynthesisprotein E [Reinekea sp. MED297] [Reinekea blandensis MED297]
MLEIRVQQDDFSVQREYDGLCRENTDDGAVVFFVGRVRDLNEGDTVTGMFLEHYPGMTEKTLQSIADEARHRWPLNRIRIVHRVGALNPSDQIVFVGVSSPHRGAAFDGAQYIMDFLKTRAPFWKKESTPEGDRWVDARSSDTEQENRW